MRHGLALPQFGRHAKPATITSFVRCAEDLGSRSFWANDHIVTPVDPSDLYPLGGTPEHPYPDEFKAFLDPIVTLAAAATVASHSRLGFSALIAPWYHPVLLARSLTSLDNLAGGRLDCGFGTGWLRDEYTTVNVAWGDRGARLDEILDVLTTIWAENPAEHHGTRFDLPRSHFDLRPVSPGGPPVLLGGWAPKAMERIGRRAAGWLPIYGTPPDILDQLWQSACRAADDAGRDPASLRRELRVNPNPGTTVDDLATVTEIAEKTGMDGVYFDLHFTTTSPNEALDTAAHLATKIDISAAE
jgi:probable F420-dependent oxidoreductase